VLEEIFTLLQSRLKESEIAQAVEDPSVRVIDAAVLPEVPIRPNKRVNLLLGIIVGLIVGVSTALLRDQMDRTVHTREQLQDAIRVSILGAIPNIRDSLPTKGDPERRGLARALASVVGEGRNGQRNGQQHTARVATSLIVGADPRNNASEAYRALRTNITFSLPDQKIRTMVFTSPLPGDGKSTTAANLAATLAQQGLRVLLIDADMRRGLMHQVFDVPREPGLSNVILRAVAPGQAERRVHINENEFFDFLATGTLPPNPAELLGSTGMKEALEKYRSDYDAVIIDSPPLNVVTDAAVLGPLVDGVILVARAGVTAVDSLAYAMDQLRNVRATVLGAVLNDLDMRRDSRYGSYGSYGYYGGYRYRDGYYGLTNS
jgi:tyrosine-protein kinase Etk/Wzc